MEVIRRFWNPPEGSFFLFGPRGTGKSTLVQTLFPKALDIDLLDPWAFRTYSSKPERLEELVMGNPDRKIVVIDEIQRVPELLPMVHRLIEAKTGRSFVLTGSSARKLRRGGTDLLAGRAVLRSLHPFMGAELGRDFNLEKALHHGLLPLVVSAKDPGDVLRGYAALYIREEVLMEGLVRNAGNFSRFLEGISFSHGSVLNLSAISRECEVHRKVVESYLGILEDLLLGFRVPVFRKRAKRAVIQKPKFYLFDAGVFRSLRPMGPLDRPEEAEGAALEGLVAQHLRAWIDYSGAGDSLHFWRTRGGGEVDFVVYGPRSFYALEVKNSSRLHPRDFRGLLSFHEDYPSSTPILLHRGKDSFLRKGIHSIPAAAFLRRLTPGKPLNDALSQY